MYNLNILEKRKASSRLSSPHPYVLANTNNMCVEANTSTIEYTLSYLLKPLFLFYANLLLFATRNHKLFN